MIYYNEEDEEEEDEEEDEDSELTKEEKEKKEAGRWYAFHRSRCKGKQSPSSYTTSIAILKQSLGYCDDAYLCDFLIDKINCLELIYKQHDKQKKELIEKIKKQYNDDYGYM